MKEFIENGITRVLFINREKLNFENKLKSTEDVQLVDFVSSLTKEIINFEVVVFICDLTKQAKVLKSRYGKLSFFNNYIDVFNFLQEEIK
jgi:hypothetical protein